MQSASNWLIEAVKQAGFDLYEKSITILESAIFHMDDATKVMDNVNNAGGVQISNENHNLMAETESAT